MVSPNLKGQRRVSTHYWGRRKDFMQPQVKITAGEAVRLGSHAHTVQFGGPPCREYTRAEIAELEWEMGLGDGSNH